MMNVPVSVGFSILQLAKLRMLEFYYDFIDCFVGRKDFQYFEMDIASTVLLTERTFSMSRWILIARIWRSLLL